MPLSKIRSSLAILAFAGVASFAGSSVHAATGAAAVGQTVTLSVTADGTLPFLYQWRKNNANISGVTGVSYVITSVQLADAGNYSVVVSNGVGSTNSDVATLTVSSAATAPVFTTQPVSTTVTANGPATFSVTANGSLVSTYRWQRSTDGQRTWSTLTNDGNYAGVTTATLTISHATVALGNSWYRCVLTNSVGSVTSNPAELTFVGAIPARPPYFDAAQYMDRYPDLTAAFATDPDWADLAWDHYWLYGLAESRSDGDFDPTAYLNMYPDLKAAFGMDLWKAALHWYTYGRAEGRRIPAGFDAAGYMARYSDVNQAYGSDLYGAWEHYLDYGVWEGRVYDERLRPTEYLAMYGDLRSAFGDDLDMAVLHWLLYGQYEGRLGRFPSR